MFLAWTWTPRGINEVDWWNDILDLHYYPSRKAEVFKKYYGKYAIQKLAITSYDVMDRFRYFNKSKTFQHRIKPYNFITIGVSSQVDEDTGKPIVPTLPYTPAIVNGRKNPKFDQIPYLPFIDYKTGKEYRHNTERYWKTLLEVFEDYFDHSEAKMDGKLGHLSRKRLVFSRSSIQYIGKEANDLEETEVVDLDDDGYVSYRNTNKLIRDMTDDLALRAGISLRQKYRLQSKIKRGERIKLNSNTKSKLKKILRS